MMWLAEPEYERRTVQQVLTTSYLDGAIISSMPVDEAMVRIVIDSRLPLVLVGRDPANSEVSYVDVENKHGAMEAVLHLARLGRKRIATLTGPLNTVVGVDRRDGYLDALQIRGLPAIPELMAEGNFSQEDGYSLMQKLIPYQPDALFAASDAMALGAMRAMRQAGLRVPDDVAVVGFDDLPFSLTTDPPLTTIRQPICQTGAMAVDMLIDMIEHPEEPQPRRIVLPVELVIRRSCGTIK